MIISAIACPGEGRGHDLAVRRPRCRHRGGDRAVHEAPPPSGVPALLANHRPPHPAETRSPPRARQLCHPQACREPAPAKAGVTAWLDKHPRFHLHFTSTSASWLNQVERFFGLITHDRIRRGVFTSVPELEAAIHDYLDHHNAHPKPFVWTKSAAEILAKVSRARRTLETVAKGNQVINSVH